MFERPVFVDADLEPLGAQQREYGLQAAFDVVHFDGDLPDHRPLLVADAGKRIEFGALDVDLQQVDARQAAGVDDVAERPQADGQRDRLELDLEDLFDALDFAVAVFGLALDVRADDGLVGVGVGVQTGEDRKAGVEGEVGAAFGGRDAAVVDGRVHAKDARVLHEDLAHMRVRLDEDKAQVGAAHLHRQREHADVRAHVEDDVVVAHVHAVAQICVALEHFLVEKICFVRVELRDGEAVRQQIPLAAAGRGAAQRIDGRDGDETLGARFAGDQCAGRANPIVLFEDALDLRELHAIAAQLDLMVEASEILEPAVGAQASAIACSVEPGSVHIGKRIRDEAIARQRGVPEIAARDARSADEQLARHTRRHGPQRLVEHHYLHVGQRPAEQWRGFVTVQ